MKPKKVIITCFIIAAAIIAWDVWLYMDAIPDNAISQIIINGSEASPMIPFSIGFFFGLLAGHWFW